MTKKLSDRQLAEKIADSLDDAPSGGLGPLEDAKIMVQRAIAWGRGPGREKLVAEAQAYIAELDPELNRRHIQQLQSQILALQGRRGDTKIAHVTPGELVIPARMMTPELKAKLFAAARKAGIDPARLIVGSKRNSINPETGQAEFQDWHLDPPNPSQPDSDEVYRDRYGNRVEGITVETYREPGFFDDPWKYTARAITRKIIEQEKKTKAKEPPPAVYDPTKRS